MFDYMISSVEADENASSYEKMLRHAKESIESRSPFEMAANAGVFFDEATSLFKIKSLGQNINIKFPQCTAVFSETGQTPYWIWHLIMLHYLGEAKGTPISGNVITFRELESGMTRGYNFDRESAHTIGSKFGQKPRENIVSACKALGAVFLESPADICAEFPFFPRFPLTLLLWLGDDEVPGSGKLLLSNEAASYLPDEDAVTAGSILVKFLKCQYELMYRE